jgi:hypothetical protein
MNGALRVVSRAREPPNALNGHSDVTYDRPHYLHELVRVNEAS